MIPASSFVSEIGEGSQTSDLTAALSSGVGLSSGAAEAGLPTIAGVGKGVGPISKRPPVPSYQSGSQLRLPFKVPALPSFLMRLKALRRRYWSTLDTFQYVGGFCYMCPVPKYLRCDKSGQSDLIVFEDSIPLGRPQSIHSEIESLGSGRYSHWQGWLFFSTSDNSNPISNGRIYTVREV